MDAEQGLSARFAGRLGAFDLDVEITAPPRGVTALFGPSGCGKTSILRCVAGLQRLPGRLSLNGDVWQGDDQSRPTFLPPHKRPIGYVFQEASLFPHLSVRANLDYGRRRALKAGAAETVRFDEVIDLLGLAHLLDRAPARLSGGERQRVAVGRALLSQPRLLLMDEPLSALDRFSKDEILPYLERLHAVLSIPVLYVSHDIAEVERLADRLVLMTAGRVRAAGDLADLLGDPSLPLAGMGEAAMVFPAIVDAFDPIYGLSTVDLSGGGGRLLLPGEQGAPGTPRRIKVLATDVSLGRKPPVDTSILNALPARIVTFEPTSAHQMTVFMALGEGGRGPRLLARISRKSWETLGLAKGELVYARIKAVALSDPAVEAPALRPSEIGR